MSHVAIVLAAGHGRRFGGDKLSATLDGEPLLHHALRAACAAPVQRVILVTRPEFTFRPDDWPAVETIRLDSDALSDSLKAGIAAAGDATGAFVFLGDMPRIPHEVAARLAAAIGTGFAAMPRHGGKPGHPVLLSAAAFATIGALTGDEGAGKLLRARDDVMMVEVDDPAIHFDVDRPDDLGCN